MKKRTYGTGSFYKLPGGKYLLRYRGKTQAVEATDEHQAERALLAWVMLVQRNQKDMLTVALTKALDSIAAVRR